MQCGGSCGHQIDNKQLSPETIKMIEKHPCYSFGAHHTYARMHLPVAPNCNISCNYCNRKFDCVHESRPGVTSEVLTPAGALEKYRRVREKVEKLSVVGIAGPGDALANWPATRESIELIRREDPSVIFCLSTNGLLLPKYAAEIIELGVRHVTVTLNTLRPETGARIYRYVTYNGRRYEGVEGAAILLENQLKGIAELARGGAAVKVNIVMIEGINSREIPDIVKKAKELGAFMTNIMPLIPASGSAFENYPQTSMKELSKMRDICQVDLQQMRHCKQCRADAIGLLGEDRSAEFGPSPSTLKVPREQEGTSKQYKIAVASKYGRRIDLHFGHASEFTIYQVEDGKFNLLEKREVDKYCTGMEECDTGDDKREQIVDSLQDCDAVLSLRIGYQAKQRLLKKGIRGIETCDTVEDGLMYAAKVLSGETKEIA